MSDQHPLPRGKRMLMGGKIVGHRRFKRISRNPEYRRAWMVAFFNASMKRLLSLLPPIPWKPYV